MRTVLAALLATVLFALALLLPSARPEPEPLLVADLRGHALILVDPTRPEELRRVPLPGGPHELLRLSDGRIAVSLEQFGSLALVDLESGAVEEVAVGGIPHGLALDGDTLLVTDRSRDIVRRFLIDDWRELEPLPVESWPHAVGVLGTGDMVVASAQPGTLTLGGDVYVTGAVTETLAVSSDGAHIATASAFDGTVHVFSTTGEVLERYEVGGRPVRVMFSPDGRTLAAALSAAHAVVLVSDGVVSRMQVEGVPDGLAFSADGSLLYVSDVFGGSVTAVDVDRLEAVAVIPIGAGTGALLTLRR